MTTLANRRAALTARQAFLLGRVSQIEDELGTHSAKDFEDMATEREGDEVLEDLGQAAQTELRMIEAALQRMDNDEYGDCVRCGEAIAPGRLDLLPATPFCAGCAAQH
jgi:RNA polymerase-binding transcription factor DksA